MRSPLPKRVTPCWPALYRRLDYPRSARLAEAIIINSESLRSEIERYLDVDPSKLKLIYEAVDHELFKPGDAAAARAHVAERYGVTKPFVLFVSSLWPLQELRRAAPGLGAAAPATRAAASSPSSADPRREATSPTCTPWRTSSASPATWSSSAGSRWTRRSASTRAEDARIPVAQRDVRAAHPRGHGVRLPGRDLERQRHARDRRGRGGAVRSERPGVDRPGHPRGAGARTDRLRAAGCDRASQFTWGATAAATLDVYREVADRRTGNEANEGPRHRRGRVHRLAHL